LPTTSAATRTSERQKKRDRHGEVLKSFIPWDAELEAMLVEDDTDGVDEEALGEHEGDDGVEGVAD
jgi:hypothetical protein